MTATTGLRRMTNKIEARPAPEAVLINGGSLGGLSVVALRAVEAVESIAQRIARVFAR